MAPTLLQEPPLVDERPAQVPWLTFGSEQHASAGFSGKWKTHEVIISFVDYFGICPTQKKHDF